MKALNTENKFSAVGYSQLGHKKIDKKVVLNVYRSLN